MKEDVPEISTLDARQRLAAILRQKNIRPTKMPWFGARAVAFTECTWTSMLDHARRYSPYGIGFHKRFLWQQGGGPAIYLRCSDLYDAQADYVQQFSRNAPPFVDRVRDFLTPFAMEPFKLRSGAEIDTLIDFSHEREWRAPNGLRFEYADVQFVIVRDFDDLGALPDEAVSAIGKDRFLAMNNYRRVEELWPTLHIDRERGG